MLSDPKALRMERIRGLDTFRAICALSVRVLSANGLGPKVNRSIQTYCELKLFRKACRSESRLQLELDCSNAFHSGFVLSFLSDIERPSQSLAKYIGRRLSDRQRRDLHVALDPK